MKNSDIVYQRLHNQHISNPSFQTPEAVVSWLGASQAQDYAGAKWALGLRMQQATDRGLDEAFNAGSILRTHLLRPTWHFVTPADIHWMLRLTAPRVHAANGTMYRKLELDEAIFQKSNRILTKALQGGQPLTREELRAALEREGIVVGSTLRLTYLVMFAELEGVLCSGPRQGKQFTYMLLEERAPQAKVLSHDEALAELARRFFHSRGPVTVQDFAKWSGLTISASKMGLEAVKPHLQQAVVNGQTYWLASSEANPQRTSPTAHLLPIYDEYISGYKDRSAIVDLIHAEKLVAMGNDLTYIIVINGQIVGTWKRTIKRDTVIIHPNLFVQLTEAEHQAFVEAAKRYGAFLELPVTLE